MIQLFFPILKKTIKNKFELITLISDRDLQLQVRHPKTQQIVARYDGLCIKRQCNMYRVRPKKRGSLELVKRYPRKLKIRLTENFLKGDNYYFEEKITLDHLKKGVWICLDHFSQVDDASFLEALELPKEAKLIKDNRQKCKSRIEVRVSALPMLCIPSLKLKKEVDIQADQDQDLEVVFEQTGAFFEPTHQEEVSVVYTSENVENNYKLNRKIFSRQNWELIEKIGTVSVHSLQIFEKKEKCFPSVMDRYIETLSSFRPGLIKIFGVSSILFEALLNDDREMDFEKYLADLDYSSQAEHFFLPYYFYGRWSLLTYNVKKNLAENYVLTDRYDWRVKHKIEKILFSVQDKLMLRRFGLFYKNTFKQVSEVNNSEFQSAIKVMSVMREIVLGKDPKIEFYREEECSEDLQECIFKQLIIGNIVYDDERLLARHALLTDFVGRSSPSIKELYDHLALK